MEVQIICDQNDFMSLRKILIHQLTELLCECMGGAILADSHSAPARQGFTHQQEIGAAFASILIILTSTPRPGFGNTSSIRCDCNSLPFSSKHTMGYSCSYGRWYTASTSSILAMKRVLTFGMHQLLIAQGRNLFFLAVSTPRYPRYVPHTLTPPSDLPTVAMSNDCDLPVVVNRPT